MRKRSKGRAQLSGTCTRCRQEFALKNTQVSHWLKGHKLFCSEKCERLTYIGFYKPQASLGARGLRTVQYLIEEVGKKDFTG